jgi:2-polyprenyl-6-methoxyphenol hydroxylase-like FAD-dependent oxidoreductase
VTATALPERTEVAIVGAGPAGLTLAVTLAAAGIDFVVLDRLAEGANTSRAAVVHARTLEVLDDLGAGEALVRRGLRLRGFTFREGARRLLTVPFDDLPTPHPYILMVPQQDTESVLAERLRELGGRVHRPYEVASVEQHDGPHDPDGPSAPDRSSPNDPSRPNDPHDAIDPHDRIGPHGPSPDGDGGGVTLTMTTGETLRARYAVGADGMHSTVREACGTGFTGHAYPESFVLADVEMDWAPGRREASLTVGPAGLVVVAPLPGGRHRVVGTVDDAPAAPGLDFVQRTLDAVAPGQARVTTLLWSSRFRIHHRVADRFRTGRLFLVGDAAHVHSPAGGQGMNTGIQDAYALGRAFAEGRLDDYEARRRPVARRVVAFTDRMTRVATARHPLARAARRLLLPLVGRVPVVRRRLARELAELDYR